MTTLNGSPPPRLPKFLHTRVGGLPRAFWVLWAVAAIEALALGPAGRGRRRALTDTSQLSNF